MWYNLTVFGFVSFTFEVELTALGSFYRPLEKAFLNGRKNFYIKYLYGVTFVTQLLFLLLNYEKIYFILSE